MASNNPSLQPEIGPDGLPREAPVISYTEMIIEAEQLQLKKYIEDNYSKIRGVERELANLTLEMKLTAGPKKAAFELLRKKIEASTERICVAKIKEEQARMVWESATKAVRDEEQAKQNLCEDLSNLVHESSNSQLSRLKELKRRLEAMNPSRASATVHQDGRSASSSQDSTTQCASSVPTTRDPSGVAENASNQRNNQKVFMTNGHTNSQSPNEAEGSNRKRVNVQLKGKGIGAIHKARSLGPGWTGAGFDVDDRT